MPHVRVEVRGESPRSESKPLDRYWLEERHCNPPMTKLGDKDAGLVEWNSCVAVAGHANMSGMPEMAHVVLDKPPASQYIAVCGVLVIWMTGLSRSIHDVLITCHAEKW